MKLLSFIMVVVVFLVSGILRPAEALFDPLSRPNNFFGVHILFPAELGRAAKFVNSSGGDWGYVTIPIQIGDRDLEKWQNFMDEAKKLHVVPILRLATEPDPRNTNVWRIPNDYDILDMANFLNSLSWPVENRYVIAYNETNRFDEWGGMPPDPKQFADVMEYTVEAFKARSSDFFVIMGGLDNAAPQQPEKYLNSFIYLQTIAQYKPELFDKIDGFSSHSYPNPGFEQPPTTQVMGVSTYLHEYEFVNRYTKSKKPVFITETGWDATAVSEETIGTYYRFAFDNLWAKNNDKIVAVTPFLLEATGGFDKFSFIKDGKPTKYYEVIAALPKTKGEPAVSLVADTSSAADTGMYILNSNTPDEPISANAFDVSPVLKFYFKTLLGIWH